MNPIESKREFERILAARHPGPGALTPRLAAAAALDFYEGRRAMGCDVEADADMLLFQWGTYDWGEGEHFEIDFTRQFMVPQGDDDPDLRQLSLTFRFPATDLLRGLGAGDRWCRSPSEVGDMRAFIEAAPGFAAVADRADGAVSLRIESAE